MGKGNIETLRRFVLRARRIAAHSLAADRSALARLAELSFGGSLHVDGTMELRRSVPNEELFESLAARVRPVLVKSESVHFEAVLQEIRHTMGPGTLESQADLRAVFSDLERRWATYKPDEDKRVVRYAMQSQALDGSGMTPQVSDTQLANAWLYGDLVHVDTKGPKSDGMLFPITERYSAAVTYFADAALLTLQTLDLLLELNARGLIEIDATVLNEDVVVGVQELVDTARSFVGPIGTPVLALDLQAGCLPDGFQAFTMTSLLRQSPENRVGVVLEAENGTITQSYDAAVLGREEIEGRLFWQALISGAVTVRVSWVLTNGQLSGGRLEGMKGVATTNRMRLDETIFMAHLQSSRRMKFIVQGEDFFALRLPEPTPEQKSCIDISIDTLEDLLGIEDATQQLLPVLTGTYTNVDRLRLRYIRLLWQGSVVPFCTGPLTVTSEAGKIPELMQMAESTFPFADVVIPTPRIHLRHPRMIAQSVRSAPAGEPHLDEVTLVVPGEDKFLAWSPDRTTVTGDGDLATPTACELTHLVQEH